VQSFLAQLQVDPEQSESPAPAGLQRILRENNVSGSVKIAAVAAVPLRDMRRARFDTTIELADARARPIGWGGGVDDLRLQVRCSTTDLTSEAWPTTLPALRLVPEPPAATQPTTTPTTAPSVPARMYIALYSGRAKAADSLLAVSGARFSLDWDSQTWRMEGLTAAMSFGENRSAVPDALKAAVEALRLSGVIGLTAAGRGSLAWPENGRPDFSVDFQLRSPRLLATQRSVALTDVACNGTVGNKGLKLIDDGRGQSGFSTMAWGGMIRGDAQVLFGQTVFGEMNVRARDIDLKQLAAQAVEKPPKLSGRGALNARLTGQWTGDAAPPGRSAIDVFMDSIAGRGDFEVVDGDFFDLPLVSAVSAKIGSSRKAATIGQAAGIFRIEDRKVRFEKLAAEAPVLGIQGSGDVGFDGQLNLEIFAVPLADWKEKVKKQGIPLLGDIAGGIQKLLNTATGKLLVRFRITGQLGAPNVKTEPGTAPAEAVKIFGEMIKGGGRLLDKMK